MATRYLQKVGAVGSIVDGSTALALASVSGTIYVAAGNHLALATQTDTKQVTLNSRNYTQATGDSIGVKSNPNQTVTTTGSVYGLQISPRYADGIAGGSLSAIYAAPVLKGTTGNLSGDVRAFEAAIDFTVATGTRTITGVVSALYAYLQVPSAGTYTGGCAVLHIPTPDQKGWDFLVNASASAGCLVVGAGTYSTSDGYFIVKVGSSTYRVPFFTAVD